MAKTRKREVEPPAPLAARLAENARRNQQRHIEQAPVRLSSEPDVVDGLVVRMKSDAREHASTDAGCSRKPIAGRSGVPAAG
jgi:hypothetical protein